VPVAPDVVGPVVGARPPFGSPRIDVAELGYVLEEYVLEGVANAYTSHGAGGIPPDGRWSATEIGEAPYRTRILVLRPADPNGFNGTVLLNWQNVSAGVESGTPSGGEMYNGYAWVGVSAQEVGLYGFPAGARGEFRRDVRPLVDHDPERYGGLQHPGDQGSFDIFTAAALAVGPNRSGPVDPLDGLEVRRVVATGASQSAMRLATYLNAVHPTALAIDGFVLALWEGRGHRLEEGPVALGARSSIRDDLDSPVVVVNSEFETIALHQAGSVDSGAQRIWEVAGAPHAALRSDLASEPGVWGHNQLSIQPVFDAAVRRVHEWVMQGIAAPSQPRIEVDDEHRPRIRRDDRGNAIGGIRLPEVAAPVAEYRGMSFGTGMPPLFGAARRFSDDELQTLYRSRADYDARWSAAVEGLVDSGCLLPEDVPALLARSEQVHLPFD
jgi:hypothetical protein